MKNPVRKNVSVSVRAPAFIVAKLDRLAAGHRGRSAAVVFLLEQGLIDLSALCVIEEGEGAFPTAKPIHSRPEGSAR